MIWTGSAPFFSPAAGGSGGGAGGGVAERADQRVFKQVEVNIDYILMLVAKYHESNCEDKTILANINKSIDASVELRSKKALIEGFIAQMTVKTDVEKDWKDFVKKQKEQDLETIIKDEKLKHAEAQKFIEMFS